MDAKTTNRPATDQDIHDRIWSSIVDRQLAPGTRLKEEHLAEIFNVNRARIRQALQHLARDGLITLVPNRGAFVAEPSIEEARDVFFARRTIEERLVERLCATIDDQGARRLRDHVAAERRAHDAGDFETAIRLSGAFHMLIADLAQSQILAGLLRDLVSRTSLITALYQSRSAHNCGPDEHEALVEAIVAHDAAAAIEVMKHHLAHIEAQLDLEGERAPARNLADILSPRR